MCIDLYLDHFGYSWLSNAVLSAGGGGIHSVPAPVTALGNLVLAVSQTGFCLAYFIIHTTFLLGCISFHCGFVSYFCIFSFLFVGGVFPLSVMCLFLFYIVFCSIELQL